MTGEELRKARKRRGWSVVDLADRLQVNPMTVYKWEEGARRITPSRQDHIRRVLG